MLSGKRFFIGVLACALLLLLGAAGLVAWVDPMFTVGGLEEGETALFVNERYEMAGLLRRQEYSNLVMGTSLVANYRASWFEEGLGEPTLKVTFPDGRLSEFDRAFDLAVRTHGPMHNVFFCLDPNVLVRDGQQSELPEYLYNDNPLDDVQFYFNAESLALAVKSLLLGDGAKVTLDEAYVWDRDSTFSVGNALAGYPRPEPTGVELPGDAYLEAAERNMDVVCSWAEEYPDTRFVIWFPPYSVLYWDQMDRLGKTEAILNALEYAAGRLLDHDNVRIHSFLNAQGLITDLSQYTDHIHCSGEVTAYETRCMLDGTWQMWKDVVPGQIGELREFVRNYDYDAVYTRYGWVDGKPPGGSTE